jgi:hypothetical protein
MLNLGHNKTIFAYDWLFFIQFTNLILFSEFKTNVNGIAF